MRNMIFIKPFIDMSDAKLDECKVRGGHIKADSRIFKTIIGYDYNDVVELERLQHALNYYLMDAEEPTETLLRAEFGRDIHSLKEADDPLDYLTQTPFSVMQMDFNKACDYVRDVYNSLS